MLSVCVFCGSTPGQDPALVREADRLGEALARAGIGLVFGGGRAGLMGAVSDGALRAGGQVIGVIPIALVDRELGRTDLTDLRVVPTMHERKALMYRLSSATVALPGGLGTFEELFETVTWNKLGLHAKPSFVLNVGGYYDPLRAMLDRALEVGFVTAAERELVTFVESVDDLLEVLGRLPRESDPVSEGGLEPPRPNTGTSTSS